LDRFDGVIGFAGGGGLGLAAYKASAQKAADATAANQPEPAEAVAVAVAKQREHRRSTTSIGTVLALRSVSLRNELPGTVRQVNLTPGQIVEPGTLLVLQDVTVEQAELTAHAAQGEAGRGAAAARPPDDRIADRQRDRARPSPCRAGRCRRPDRSR
jgi:membrane fusion protein (multidrug efflux system)